MSSSRTRSLKKSSWNTRMRRMPRSPSIEYHAIAHWMLAIFVALLIGSGFAFGFQDDAALRFRAAVWHKSIGATLLLAFIPIFAVLVFRRRRETSTDTPVRRISTRFVRAYHLTMCIMIAGMLTSGWTASSLASFSAPAWIAGIVELPDFPGLGAISASVTSESVGRIHSIIARILAIVVCGHVAAALFHVWREEHFFSLIWPWHGTWRFRAAIPYIIVVALLLLVLGAAQWSLIGAGSDRDLETTENADRSRESEIPQPINQSTYPKAAHTVDETLTPTAGEVGSTSEEAEQQAKDRDPRWEVVPTSRRLSARVETFGQPIVVKFPDWDARVLGEIDRPEAASARVVVDLSSLSTGSPEIDSLAMGASALDIARSPTALLYCNRPRLISEDRFSCAADLTIRQITRKTPVHFQIRSEGDNAAWIEGQFAFDPAALGIDIPAERAGQAMVFVEFALEINRRQGS